MMTLLPAYGRDYKSKKALLADFENEKDFILCDMFSRYDGKPINKQQITDKTIMFRYGNQRKIFIHKL